MKQRCTDVTQSNITWPHHVTESSRTVDLYCLWSLQVIFTLVHYKQLFSYNSPTPVLLMLCFTVVFARCSGPSWIIFGAIGVWVNEWNRGPSYLLMNSVSTAKGPNEVFKRCFAINRVLIKLWHIHMLENHMLIKWMRWIRKECQDVLFNKKEKKNKVQNII